MEETINSEESKSVWAWVVTAVVVIGIIVALAYLPKKTAEAPAEKDAKTEQLGSVSSSDETADIEADLNNTDLNNIDQELSQIEKELQ